MQLEFSENDRIVMCTKRCISHGDEYIWYDRSHVLIFRLSKEKFELCLRRVTKGGESMVEKEKRLQEAEESIAVE